MARKTGSYITITTTGESVKAFIPYALPPAKPTLDVAAFAEPDARGEQALSKLAGVASLVPSVEWLVYGAMRKEALLTSLIEGTQATLTDLFDAESDIEVGNPDDVEEVLNYLRALKYVRAQLADPKGLPLSVRLLCEAHRELMTGTRGKNKQPGEIRKSQNWIGGTRPGNAVFVPPPPGHVPDLLADLEKFIHGNDPLPPLVKIGLIHAQFETIHPFLDGNGRIGRLLISVLLEDWGMLDQPLLAISAFLKQHQAEYYRRLANIRLEGDWEGWTAFFLEAVEGAAAESQQTVIDLAALVSVDRAKVHAVSALTPATVRLFELLPSMPRFTAEQVRGKLETSMPTTNAAIATLVELGIVAETSGKKRNRTFSYGGYVERLGR